jgi:hypothetical protein
MANVQDATLSKVVGEICDMLARVILLAPDDQRIELADFALTRVASIYDRLRENSRPNIGLG